MKRIFALVLVIYCGSLPSISINAFPAGTLEDSLKSSNQTLPSSADTELTEYPVFIEEAQQQTTSSTESEVVTESYMVIEEQEDDGDDESDSSTVSSAIVKTTLPMQPPKSSPEQEEVLRELKKLWDYSEGLSDTQDNGVLKNSLSSLVHLAYARIYSEPDDTLSKLKYLLQKLQARLLGTESNGDDESLATTTQSFISSSTSFPTITTTSTEPNYMSPSVSPTNLMTATTLPSRDDSVRRRKRSYYDGYGDIESIFYTNNVNSAENSIIPDDKHNHNQSTPRNGAVQKDVDSMNSQLNDTLEDPLDRSLLSIGAVSSSTVVSVSSTPYPLAQKVIHINDRQKPPSPFYLSPERIKELKSRMTSTTPNPNTSTLPPISIIIDDELENEVNSLQQQHQVDNYDVQISVTTPSSAERIAATTIGPSSVSTTEVPFTAEEIALALFQLLRPDSDSDDEDNVTSPRPSPSSILYQVGSLSSAYNLTRHKNTSMISTPSSEAEDDLNTNQKNNSTWLIVPPPALSNLGYTTSSTERHSSFYNQSDVLQVASESDQTNLLSEPSSMSPTKIINGTKESISQMVQALTGLSTGAKTVLLFALSISVLSIGLGVYALGPPLVGVGLLGIIIPIGLLLLFETGAGKRRLTTRQQQLLIDKLHSEEFSKVLDLIFDAMKKYSKG